MRTILAAGCVLMLAACGPKAEKTAENPPPPASVAGCSAATSVDWSPTEAASLHIAAAATGDACDAGKATLTITNDAGATLFTETFDVAPMTSTVFVDAKSPPTLEAALKAWIDPVQNGAATTATLPPWPAGADQPASGEYPFYPADGASRDAYLRLRGQGRPMYCFVQGGESSKCLALDAATGALSEIGLQTFPG